MANKFDKSKSKLFSRRNPNIPKYTPPSTPEDESWSSMILRTKKEMDEEQSQKEKQKQEEYDLFIVAFFLAIIRVAALLLAVYLFIQLY